MPYSGTILGSTKFSRPFSKLHLYLNFVPAGAGRHEEVMVVALPRRTKLNDVDYSTGYLEQRCDVSDVVTRKVRWRGCTGYQVQKGEFLM
jgi:hypothetical protein